MYSDRILFDGFLPPYKEFTRKSRLEASLRQLKTFSPSNQDSKSAQGVLEDFVLTPEILFDSNRAVPSKFQGLPAAPFLVPAVLDALSNSPYLDITEVVPGEADWFCADVARRCGGVILTSDSDLLVYDTGVEGAVVFFHHIDLQTCSVDAENTIISAKVFKPYAIAKQLRVNSISRLAFELKEDGTITLQEAVLRASQQDKGVEKQKAFEELESEYVEGTAVTAVPFEGPVHPHSQAAAELLDPRVSELVLQLSYLPQKQPSMYLPFLIEDPTRASAWIVGIDFRCVAYSLLVTAGCCSTVREYRRKGFRIRQSEINIISMQQCSSYARRFNQRLRFTKQQFHTQANSEVWANLAVSEVYSHFLDNGQSPPSSKALRAALDESHKVKFTWQAVQLAAQLQAALYSMRLLKQVLNYVLCRKPKMINHRLRELHNELESLPALSELFASRIEHSHLSEQVLVAILPPELTHSSTDRNQFAGKECRATAQLDNQHSILEEEKLSGNGKLSIDLVQYAKNPYSILNNS